MDVKYGQDNHTLHCRLADAIAEHYVDLRTHNITELSQIAIAIGNRLDTDFLELKGDDEDDDPLICVWDLAYNIFEVISIVVAKSNGTTLTIGRERNSTDLTMVEDIFYDEEYVNITKVYMEQVIDDYNSLLERYRLIRDFMEGK